LEPKGSHDKAPCIYAALAWLKIHKSKLFARSLKF